MSMKYLRACLLSVVLASFAGAAFAEDNPVVLTVSGKITHYTDEKRKVYEFHEKDLLSLPPHTITTKTNWTPKWSFTGPLMRDILQRVGATGHQVKFVAINDYAIKIDAADFTEFNAVLARRVENKLLDVAHKGPLWLMYPLPDMADSLKGPDLDAKLIWQVDRVVVH